MKAPREHPSHIEKPCRKNRQETSHCNAAGASPDHGFQPGCLSLVSSSSSSAKSVRSSTQLSRARCGEPEDSLALGHGSHSEVLYCNPDFTESEEITYMKRIDSPPS